MSNPHLQMNFAGHEWLSLKEWLLKQRMNKHQRLLQPEVDQREVENLRGSLQFIEFLLSQERAAQSWAAQP